MKYTTKLFVLKILHTFVWLVMASACFYILYSCAVMKFGSMFMISSALIVIEIVALASANMACPLRLVAMKYTDKVYDGFDIFLPAWVARHNVVIFTGVLTAALVVYLWNRVVMG